MATVDSIDAFSLLQNMAPMSYDSSRLVDVACIAYAHVDDAHIKELRGKFLPTVQRQFQVAVLPVFQSREVSLCSRSPHSGRGASCACATPASL